MKIERINEIYAELDGYYLELDPNPVALGPRYLQDLMSTCRNYLNRVSRLVHEVTADKQMANRELHAFKTVFDMERDNLIANDERCRRLPNIKDRESTADTILSDQRRAILMKEAEVADLVSVERTVRFHYSQLRDTMGEIRTQKGLIQSEIDTGAMYGDERSHGPRGRRLEEPDMISDDEVARILSEPKVPDLPTALVKAVSPPIVVPDPPVAPLPEPVVEPQVQMHSVPDPVLSVVSPAAESTEHTGSKHVNNDPKHLAETPAPQEYDPTTTKFLNGGTKGKPKIEEFDDFFALLDK